MPDTSYCSSKAYRSPRVQHTDLGTKPPAQTFTPAQCASSLTCTYADFNLMSMSDRLLFVQTLESQQGPAFGATMQWRNIEAIISFFHDNNLGAPGSWVSYTDASILEGLGRGFAISLGLPAVTCENPCAALWASFIQGVKSGAQPFFVSPICRLTWSHTGALADRPTHDYSWSIAEQSCSDYGSGVLSPMYHAVPTEEERIWFAFSQLYRWIMRNEALTLNVLSFVPGADELILWLTDVTDFTSTRELTQLAWDSAKGVAGFLDIVVGVPLLLWYAPSIISEWKKETGGVGGKS
jgi:hypothetical protein